ncbi:ABC transporter permease subunit [Pseudonocardia acidicola]|uniref:ABC transporter permease subunit n=1 Tax=Pseudonocardia acidicola TaxID=2724939 RepID=A0ABX1SJQ8_9PSEU|nr:ABC transporter permease subunit [Pseudonocardia acidicola]NMI01814.1 ABC transporter permease subunit [Pseudonocardia acidicola]
MSTLAAGTASARTAGTGQVTLLRTIASEWIKFRTLWSSVLVAAVSVVGMIAIGWVGSYFTNADWAHMRPRELARFDPVVTSLNGYNMAELAVGTLGVLLVTGEYSTGMIRATMAAVPARLPVLWAKLTVYTGVTFVLMTATSFLAFLGGQFLLGSHSTSLSADGVLRVVVATGIYLTLVGVLGVAFGALVRNTAGGIAALFGVLLVLPVIVGVLPSTWQDQIGKYLPSNAGQAALTVKPDPAMLAPWTGMAVFAGYAVVAVVAAAVLLKRRDV